MHMIIQLLILQTVIQKNASLLSYLMTTDIGISSESPEIDFFKRWGVDCRAGGGSVMLRKGSNEALSLKPNPSLTSPVPSAAPKSPQGDDPP